MSTRKWLWVFELWVLLVALFDVVFVSSFVRMAILLGAGNPEPLVPVLVDILVVVNFPYHTILGHSVYSLSYFLNGGLKAGLTYALLSAVFYQLLLLFLIPLVRVLRVVFPHDRPVLRKKSIRAIQGSDRDNEAGMG